MLTQKTFKTKDSRGCEFECKCQIVRNYKGGPIIESHYYGMGLVANSLKELQEMVGEKVFPYCTKTNICPISNTPCEDYNDCDNRNYCHLKG